MEYLKPQDLMVLLKILQKGPKRWKYQDLENELGVSKSVVHRALSRCAKAKLISPSPFEYIFAGNLKEFLLHGVQFAFATEPGSIVKGTYTAHSAPVLKNQIISEKDQYVWPYSKGKARGQKIEPLHERVPVVAEQDTEMYELLALIDAIRVGKAREKEIASRLLTDKIDHYAHEFK